MAITLTNYPVVTEAGQFLNAFAGFKPIELEFTADAGEVSIECVLVDPNDENIDLLGFELYVDFDPDGIAVVDVSIINDKNKQGVLLESQSITDSRIKYRVKYREAGTTDAYVLIAAPILPLISVYAIADFPLDKWLDAETETTLWLGYPNLNGFIHSDANEVGLDIFVNYDLLDIQKNILVADTLVHDFGANTYGVDMVKIEELVDPPTGLTNFPFANAGFDPATDWTDVAVSGIGDGFTADAGGTLSILSGGSFSGRYQRLVPAIGGDFKFMSDEVKALNPLLQYTLTFFAIGSGASGFTNWDVWLDATGVITQRINVTENNALIPLGTSSFRFVVESRDTGIVAGYLDLDEIRLSVGEESESAYIDLKINSL